MRKLALLAVCVAGPALAGETLLGTLISSDGGVVTNRTTGYTAYACPANTSGGCFVVTPQTKITVQCNQAAYFLTDSASASSTTGLRLSADQMFPSSINTNKTLTAGAYNSDGGSAGVAVTYTGGWVSAQPQSGASLTCRVYSRSGTE